MNNEQFLRRSGGFATVLVDLQSAGRLARLDWSRLTQITQICADFL